MYDLSGGGFYERRESCTSMLIYSSMLYYSNVVLCSAADLTVRDGTGTRVYAVLDAAESDLRGPLASCDGSLAMSDGCAELW